MTNNDEGFLEQIATLLPVLRATERKLDLEIGRQFNAFSLFNTDENASSRILAFLLDPQETHGQDTAFLLLFVHKFLPKWHELPLGDVNVIVENETEERRRIDVYLKIGDHHIGIENKFRGASDQRNQILHYLQDLEKKAKKKENKFKLIYLGPKGEEPSDESYPKLERDRYKDQFILGSWIPFPHEGDAPDDILSWLEECIKDCQADNIRWFLKQFASYVHNEILGKREADMTNETIINLALKHDDNLEAALRIAECCEELKERILKEFLECVHKRMTDIATRLGEDWEVKYDWPGGNWTKTPSKKYLPIQLRKKNWPHMVGISIVAEFDGPRGVMIGVSAPTKDVWKRIDDNLYGDGDIIDIQGRKMIENVVKPVQTGWWVYWKNYKIKDWTNVDALIHLHNNKDDISELESSIQLLAEKMQHPSLVRILGVEHSARL